MIIILQLSKGCVQRHIVWSDKLAAERQILWADDKEVGKAAQVSKFSKMLDCSVQIRRLFS